ncbi:kinase-like domain-containing protein [Boletus edulis]|nr:kinase-like domain-containing protein [Boletus edulis]
MVQVLHRLRELPARLQTLRKQFNIKQPKSSDPNSNPGYEQFFRYTFGRWIYNEREQMGIRYTPFDVDALKQIAATAAGANLCVQMVKLAEGSFKKIFLLTFDNYVRLIAKVPCSLVAPRRLCTASEVATMDYARTVLGLPVPRILRWSATADTSGVGTEYILMKYTPGVELRKRLNTGSFDDTRFVDRLVDMECKFTRFRFSQIGSLYYKEDVSSELQQQPLYAEGVKGGGSDRFRIGPCVDFDMWRGERRHLAIDRGPWPDTLSYVRAIVDIEKAWLSTFAVPRERGDPFRRPGSDNDPDAHARLLDDFLAVLPIVLPSDAICAPVLWHMDLHASNILVPRQGSSGILGLLDWQGTTIRPLFLQATFAPCVRYQGDDRIRLEPGLAFPSLPPDFPWLSEREQVHLRDQVRLAVIHKYYELRGLTRNAVCDDAQRYVYGKFVVPSVRGASRTWYQGTHHLRQALLKLREATMQAAPGTPFPIHWDADQVATHRAAYARLETYAARVDKVTEALQLQGDGWVSNERYDKVRRASRRLRRRWDASESGGPYPFQEGGWSWFLS